MHYKKEIRQYIREISNNGGHPTVSDVIGYFDARYHTIITIEEINESLKSLKLTVLDNGEITAAKTDDAHAVAPKIYQEQYDNYHRLIQSTLNK